MKTTQRRPLQGTPVAGRERTPAKRKPASGVAQRSPFVATQRKMLDTMFGSAVQRQTGRDSAGAGLPDGLKAGIEALSGISMDGVRVHRNSSDPAQLSALAFAQGEDIHLAPGQDQHLPHEAWHVVQQAQGRVRPTLQMKNGVPVNDDPKLEHEADAMGAMALRSKPAASDETAELDSRNVNGPAQRRVSSAHVVQRAGTKPNTASTDGRYRIKLSSAREAFVYQHSNTLGIGGALPGHHAVQSHTLNASGAVDTVTLVGGTVVHLANPITAPSPNQRLLVIDTVGYEHPAPGMTPAAGAEKLFMDVKLGFYTKSGEQFRNEGAGTAMQWFKWVEHNLKDLSRTSRSEGYDIDAENLEAFNAKLELEKRSGAGANMKAAIGHVLTQIAPIIRAVSGAPITFCGSSLFMVFNLRNPAHSEVKLIDPDHPIVDAPGVTSVTGAGGAVPADVTTRGNVQRDWNDYWNKWASGFIAGAGRFSTWLHARQQEL